MGNNSETKASNGAVEPTWECHTQARLDVCLFNIGVLRVMTGNKAICVTCRPPPQRWRAQSRALETERHPSFRPRLGSPGAPRTPERGGRNIKGNSLFLSTRISKIRPACVLEPLLQASTANVKPLSRTRLKTLRKQRPIPSPRRLQPWAWRRSPSLTLGALRRH